MFVRGAEARPEGIELRLSDGRVERLEPSTLRQDEAGVLYCTVREGRLAACFDRSAVAQIEGNIDADEQGIFVRVGQEQRHPPVVADPLEP